MKLSVTTAEKIALMLEGEKIVLSSVRGNALVVITAMLENGIIKKQIKGRSKAYLFINDKEATHFFLKNHYGIDDLERYIIALRQDEVNRAEAVSIASDSKLKSGRTFKGFLVNSLSPIECTLSNQLFILQSQPGAFTFIYDFEKFIPPKDVTIVGIENPFNFRYIELQKELFTDIKPLFVSRYPQTKDLITWLQNIPNKYVHFGDFDYAGLNIYINTYKVYLKERSSFFLPPNVEVLLSAKGNRDLYNNQQLQFDEAKVDERDILKLLSYIKKYKKGLEQEVYAGSI